MQKQHELNILCLKSHRLGNLWVYLNYTLFWEGLEVIVVALAAISIWHNAFIFDSIENSTESKAMKHWKTKTTNENKAHKKHETCCI